MNEVSETGWGRGCGEKGVSLGTRHTLEEEPLRKRMGEGIRAQNKDEGVVQRAGPLPRAPQLSHSVNGGNQGLDQDAARCSPAGAQLHSQ